MDDQQFPAPYGLNQNYEHPVSQAKVLVVINAVCIALMLLFVGIRIYTKHYILRSVGWDDCELLISLGMSSLTETRYLHCCGGEWRSEGFCASKAWKGSYNLIAGICDRISTYSL